jgi:hypothetical protein
MLTRLSRALAWIVAAAIVVLTVVPAWLRPQTGLPHGFEHFAIFALCGGAFGVGYGVARRLQAAALVLFAGAIEISQLFVPGRHARLIDFAVDAAAACIGLLAGGIMARYAPKLARLR